MPFNVMLRACQNLQLNILSENNNESNMDAVGRSLMGTLITWDQLHPALIFKIPMHRTPLIFLRNEKAFIF